jgi:hypothetical protein
MAPIRPQIDNHLGTSSDIDPDKEPLRMDEASTVKINTPAMMAVFLFESIAFLTVERFF